MQPGEMLVSLDLPAPRPGSGARYQRFIPRNEMDIAVASAGVSIALDGAGNIGAARVAIGAVAASPLKVPAAPAAILGKAANRATFELAGEAAYAAATPINDMRGGVAQRKHLCKVLTIRALEGALQRLRENR
jgi:carbon-monoxide dehydrogenase medium subunit